MKKTLLRLLLVCFIVSYCLFAYKTFEFMCETSTRLEKYERNITVLRLELDFQKSKLEDINTILEQVLNR